MNSLVNASIPVADLTVFRLYAMTYKSGVGLQVFITGVISVQTRAIRIGSSGNGTNLYGTCDIAAADFADIVETDANILSVYNQVRSYLALDGINI